MVPSAATEILLVERRADQYIATFFRKVNPVGGVIFSIPFGCFIFERRTVY
jgi:hypothetical protein